MKYTDAVALTEKGELVCLGTTVYGADTVRGASPILEVRCSSEILSDEWKLITQETKERAKTAEALLKSVFPNYALSEDESTGKLINSAKVYTAFETHFCTEDTDEVSLESILRDAIDAATADTDETAPIIIIHSL